MSTQVIASKAHVWRGKRRQPGDKFKVQPGELKLGQALKLFTPAPLTAAVVAASPIAAVATAAPRKTVARKTVAPAKLTYGTRALSADTGSQAASVPPQTGGDDAAAPASTDAA